MQEIKTNWDELSFLRKTINSKCKQRTSRELDIKSSLNAYSYLAEDMARFVQPDSHTSEGLLRKLFYDTRDDDHTIFRLSFLDTCYKYISDNQYTRAEYLRNQKNKDKSPVPRSVVIPGTLLLVLIPVIYFLFADSERFVPFEEDFDNVSKAGLLERGWMILDEDSTYLQKQLKEGYLTLYTLAGDYWVKEGEEKLIKNVLVKKINCRNCRITMKIDSFLPTMPWQQAGFLLSENKGIIKEHLRFSFSFSNIYEPNPMAEPVIRRGINLYTILDDQALHVGTKYTSRDYPSIIMILERIEDTISAFVKYNYEWDQMRSLEISGGNTVDFDFKYIALAAFHGWSNDDKDPLNADTIPVYIDYVKVEAID